MSHHPHYGYQPHQIERLREAANIETDDTPVPNYKCQICGNQQHVDDHKQHAPNWCRSCEDVTSFAKYREANRQN